MQQWQITEYESIDSTNSALKRMTEAAHGTVICSRVQTQGRGRLGRSFASEEGGLYLSVLLKRDEPPESLLHLTAMAAVAVRRAIMDACGLQTQIKWVNDLVCEGKKVCGILTELAGQGRYIIGIGINCNTVEFAPELREIAESLCSFCGRVDIAHLRDALIARLQELDRGLFSQKEAWMREFSEHCLTVGKPVRLLRAGTCTEAFAEGVDADGALLVRLADGTRQTVSAGEVSVRGLYGYTSEK